MYGKLRAGVFRGFIDANPWSDEVQADGRKGRAAGGQDLRRTCWKPRGIEHEMGYMRTLLQKPGSPDGYADAWVEPSRVVVMCFDLVFSGEGFLGHRVVIWKSERVSRTCRGRSYVTINCVRAAESFRSTSVAEETAAERTCWISGITTLSVSHVVQYLTGGAQGPKARRGRRRE